MKPGIFICLLLVQFLIAGEWEEVHLLDVPAYGLIGATSVLEADVHDPLKSRYGVHHVFDRDYGTAWAEGEEDSGFNQSIYVVIPETCRTINFFNGYGRTSEVYAKNNRLKKVKLSCLAGISPAGYVSELYRVYKTLTYKENHYLSLQDTFALQTFPFPFSLQELDEFRTGSIGRFKEEFKLEIDRADLILQFEIMEVYPGRQWDDTCISEIFFNHLYLHHGLEDIHPPATDFSVNEAENTIVAYPATGSRSILLQDTASVFQIIETSRDMRWMTVIRMPAHLGESRMETEYLLINTRSGKVVNSELERLIGENISGPFLFEYRDDTLMFEYSTVEGSASIELR